MGQIWEDSLMSVADPGGGGKGAMAPPPWPVKIGQKKMATMRSGLYFMFLGPPPLSEVSGSATECVHFFTII